MWVCYCDCGKEVIANTGNLNNGHTKSCGCLRTETIIKLSTTHGQSTIKTTPEYNTWRSMYARCYNKQNKSYKNYGKRGISVCKRWRFSFENFFADMGNKPSNIHSLDRYPNNNGNYKKSNCRWATPRQQSNNRRNSRIIKHNGAIMTLAEWTRFLNVKHSATLLWYIDRHGIGNAVLHYSSN